MKKTKDKRRKKEKEDKAKDDCVRRMKKEEKA